jgi:hypothetical protein
MQVHGNGPMSKHLSLVRRARHLREKAVTARRLASTIPTDDAALRPTALVAALDARAAKADRVAQEAAKRKGSDTFRGK